MSQNPDIYWDAFQDKMRGLGYVDGTNISYEKRDPEGKLERIPALIAELVQRKVNVLVSTNNAGIKAAKKATATIPIVMVTSIEPIAAGYVTSLSRPGGNITGVANLQRELSSKRIEIIREILPKLTRVAILWDAAGPGPKIAVGNYEAAARSSGLLVQSLPVGAQKIDSENAIDAAKSWHAGAIIIVSNPTTRQHREIIIAVSKRNKLPTLVETSNWVSDGGLISYGTSTAEIGQRMAVFVDRLLKGAKPAELPVEQPTTFELVVNLKTAKALGIKIPQSILVQATKVIE
ncbi:MAG: ABC transporter substrate-binding protein [Betaproteobacteria bacterium]